MSIWATTSTVSFSGDQGADPNALVEVTDDQAATSLPSSETFSTVMTPTYGQVVRGVSFTPGPPQVATAASVTGTPTDGQWLTLAYKFSSPDAPTYRYGWQRCSDQAMTQNCAAVGSNSRFYKLSSADVGDYLTATATATDQESQSTSSTSAVLGPVAAPAAPAVVSDAAVTGTATDGQWLTLGDRFSSPDGLSYRYGWQRCSDQAMTQNCAAVGSNSRFYKLSSADVGDYLTATATATDQESQSTSSTSAVLGPISP